MCEMTKEDVVKQLPNILTEYLKETMKYEIERVISDIECEEDRKRRRTECYVIGKTKEVYVRFDMNSHFEHINLCKDVGIDIYTMWSWNKESKEVIITVGAFWDSIII